MRLCNYLLFAGLPPGISPAAVHTSVPGGSSCAVPVVPSTCVERLPALRRSFPFLLSIDLPVSILFHR